MRKYLNLRPNIALGLILAFLANTFGHLPMAQADEFRLPAPGVMVHLSPEFNPSILKGIKVHPDNPFRFDFILVQGDQYNSHPERSEGSQQEQLKSESTRLIKYFLASLTIPEKDLWVNLSPYEKDRIIPSSFGLTEMGRDLLAEDYMLKQITASLIYPEDEIGKKFWKRIYEEAYKKFGTTDIPVNTFNKVWIVPEKAVVYENAKAGTAYVVESKLKVMLEQDYLALQKHAVVGNAMVSLGANIVREIVIPELNKEVNEGKSFSQLRQVYNSLILATWYKKKIKDSILSQVYESKNKIAGVGYKNSIDVEGVYQRYLQAFKKGAYNYIKEEQDPITQQVVPRKYFSGGTIFDDASMSAALKFTGDQAAIAHGPLDHAMIITTDITGADLPGRKKLSVASGEELKTRYREVVAYLNTEIYKPDFNIAEVIKNIPEIKDSLGEGFPDVSGMKKVGQGTKVGVYKNGRRDVEVIKVERVDRDVFGSIIRSFILEIWLLESLAAAAPSLHIPRINKIYIKEDRKNYYLATRMSSLEISSNASEGTWKQFSIIERLDILIGLAKDLQEIHQYGFLHNDIKPTNILVSKLRKFLWIDLNIFILDGAIDNTGTPGYRAPDKPKTVRSDIYSFGLTLYRLLVGDCDPQNLPPDLFTSSLVRFMKLKDVEASGLKSLIVSMRALEPSDRPASMADVIEKLESVKEYFLARGLERASRNASMISQGSALSLLGQVYGINFDVPRSFQQEGFWEYELKLDAPQRELINQHIIPAYFNAYKFKHSTVRLVFYNDRPILIVSDGLSWETVPRDIQENIVAKNAGHEAEFFSELSEKGLSLAYGAVPLATDEERQLFDQAEEWNNAHHAAVGLYAEQLFSHHKIDTLEHEVVTFKDTYPPKSLSSRLFQSGIRPKKNSLVYVLGSGSGVDVIATAEKIDDNSKVVAIDVDPMAVASTKYNVDSNSLGSKVEVKEGNLFDVKGEPLREKADHIYFNMPLPDGIDAERDIARVDPGAELFMRLLKEAHAWLKDDGTLEITQREEPLMIALMLRNGWDIAVLEGTDISRKFVSPNYPWDYARWTLVPASKAAEDITVLKRYEAQWIELAHIRYEVKTHDARDWDNPVEDMNRRYLEDIIAAYGGPLASFHQRLLAKSARTLLGMMDGKIVKEEVPNFRVNDVYKERLERDRAMTQRGVITGEESALTREEIELLKQKFPDFDWENASKVIWPELTRERSQSLPSSGNEVNYWHNQVLVRAAFLRLMKDLIDGELQDDKVFVERFREIHRRLLLGMGDSIYVSGKVDDPSTRLQMASSAAGNLLEGDVQGSARLQHIKAQLQYFLGHHWDSNDSDQIIRWAADFYAGLVTGRNIFPYGNHSLMMNCINALLRMKGLRGVSHGYMDILSRGDADVSAEEIRDDFIERANEAQDQAMQTEQALLSKDFKIGDNDEIQTRGDQHSSQYFVIVKGVEIQVNAIGAYLYFSIPSRQYFGNIYIIDEHDGRIGIGGAKVDPDLRRKGLMRLMIKVLLKRYPNISYLYKRTRNAYLMIELQKHGFNPPPGAVANAYLINGEVLTSRETYDKYITRRQGTDIPDQYRWVDNFSQLKDSQEAKVPLYIDYELTRNRAMTVDTAMTNGNGATNEQLMEAYYRTHQYYSHQYQFLVPVFLKRTKRGEVEQWDNFSIEEIKGIEKGLIPIDTGIFEKRIFAGIPSIKDTILDPNSRKSIWVKVSSPTVGVHLRPGPDLIAFLMKEGYTSLENAIKDITTKGDGNKFRAILQEDMGVQLYWKGGERKKWAEEAKKEVEQKCRVPNDKSDWVSFGRSVQVYVSENSYYEISIDGELVRCQLYKDKKVDGNPIFYTLGKPYIKSGEFQFRVEHNGEDSYRMYFHNLGQYALLNWHAIPDTSVILGTFKQAGNKKQSFGVVDPIKGVGVMVAGSGPALKGIYQEIVTALFDQQAWEEQSKTKKGVENFVLGAVIKGEDLMSRLSKFSKSPTAFPDINAAVYWKDPQDGQRYIVVVYTGKNNLYKLKHKRNAENLIRINDDKGDLGEKHIKFIKVDANDAVLMTTGVRPLRKDSVFEEDIPPEGVADKILPKQVEGQKQDEKTFSAAVGVMHILDDAMTSSVAKHYSSVMKKKVGGIDLTPAVMNLQTQNSDGAIKFHMDPAMLQQLQNASGFVPVIVNIQSISDLRMFLGIDTLR